MVFIPKTLFKQKNGSNYSHIPSSALVIMVTLTLFCEVKLEIAKL